MSIEDLERLAAQHWQAPDTGRCGEWLLRAAGGFTGRANSALPTGDPGMPLAQAVDEVQAWYHDRGLPAMIVLFEGARPHPLTPYLAERAWYPRQNPAYVMTAAIADVLAASPAAHVDLSPEPDEDFLRLYKYMGQDLPPIAHALLMSSPWQAFGAIRRDGRTVAVGRVSVAEASRGGLWAGLTAVQVDASCQRQGLGRAITTGLAAAAAEVGARDIFLQVGVANEPARQLYLRSGFRDSHKYTYMLAPKHDRVELPPTFRGVTPHDNAVLNPARRRPPLRRRLPPSLVPRSPVQATPTALGSREGPTRGQRQAPSVPESPA